MIIPAEVIVIAPRYQKPPSGNCRTKSMCARCPSNNTCRRLNKHDLPVYCEAIWDTDVAHIERTSDIILIESGFYARTQLWGERIWARYQEVAEAV